MSTLLAVFCSVVAAFFLAIGLRLLFASPVRRAEYNEARLAMKLCKKFNTSIDTFSEYDRGIMSGLKEKGLIQITVGGIYFPTQASVTTKVLKRVWGR